MRESRDLQPNAVTGQVSSLQVTALYTTAPTYDKRSFVYAHVLHFTHRIAQRNSLRVTWRRALLRFQDASAQWRLGSWVIKRVTTLDKTKN